MPCGIMVEIPAVAVMAEIFAEEAILLDRNQRSRHTRSRWIAVTQLAPRLTP